MEQPVRDFSHLYDRRTLEKWQGRYHENLQWNLDNVVLGRLDPGERRRLAGLKLESPLLPAGSARSCPFAFYCHTSGRTVVLPTLSLKFVDDLAVASAWLESAGYSQETVTDYISLLKFADPSYLPGKRYPPPLEALHIPDNALDDATVDDMAQKILKSTILWIMGHEVGHILYQHPAYASMTPQQAQRTEAEADHFATEVFRRLGVVPAGMAIFFTLLVHFLGNRGDYPSDAAWEHYLENVTTHPASPERLQMLTQELLSSPDRFAAAQPVASVGINLVKSVARTIQSLSTFLQDHRLQMLFRARAATVSLDTLAPRPVGGFSLSNDLTDALGRSTQLFAGVYWGKHTRNLAKGGTEAMDVCLVLTRRGEVATGRFSFGVGEGRLKGGISGRELFFDWQWGDAFGRGTFVTLDDDSFEGQWGHGGEADGGGTWTGVRQQDPVPGV